MSLQAPTTSTAAEAPDDLPIPPRHRTLKRAGLALLAGVVIVVLVHVSWGCEARRRLDAAIATYRARGELVTLDDFRAAFPPLPDRENAAKLYEEAGRLIWRRPAPTTPEGEPSAQPEAVLEELRRNTGQAVALVRKARALPRANWGVKLDSPTVGTMLPWLSPQRDLSRALNSAALDSHAQGDDGEAVERLRDALDHAHKIGGESPFLLCHLVHLSCAANAISTIETLAPGLRVTIDGHSGAASPEQVRALIGNLLDERRLREQWRQVGAGERMLALDSAAYLSDGGVEILGYVATPTPSTPVLRPVVFALRPMFELDAVFMMDHLTHWTDAGLEESYPAACAAMPRFPGRVNAYDGFAHLLAWTLLPSYERAITLTFRAIATRRMAATALAIRLYETDYGARPDRLDDLVPEYLPAVPADPFAADNRPLGYLPDAPRALLYSVGENGMDEGGTYKLRSGGWIDYDALDIPFFLDAPPPIAPASSQAVEDDGQPGGQ